MNTVKNFNLNNKTVILRCDLNVTIKDGQIIDDTRIASSLKTITYILDQNAKLIIMSHLGKVKTEADKKLNDMKIVYERINELLPNKVSFINSTNYEEIKEKLNDIDYGKALLIQNTRYEDLNGKKESNCDETLSKNWASLGEIFVNDAFGTIHRKHASNYGISSHLPSAIGFLIEDELRHLNKLDNPERPFIVIMGGAKVQDKISTLKYLIDKADYILVGGAIAYTFLHAQNFEVGESIKEEESIELCIELLEKYKEKIILPKDFYGKINDNKVLQRVGEITDNFKGLDIGKDTVEKFKEVLSKAKTVFWNGPLGMYEDQNYICGTKAILEYLKNNVETVILGGGDIVASSNLLGYTKDITFASTGGGATLEYLTNHEQPGLINIQ